MCYPSPGLRCSGDLAKALDAGRRRTERARLTLEGATLALHDLKKIPDADLRYVKQAQSRVAEAREAYDNTLLQYQYDLDEYDATMRGQKELKALIKKAELGGMHNHREFYRERMERGATLRRQKMSAYRATWGRGASPTHEGSVPTPDDIFALGSTGETIEVVYRGSYRDRQGVCEVVAVESVEGGGRYTLRTLDGEYLHHVRGASLRLFGD